MEQTLSQMLKSPIFWVGTVVVGLILNLISNRLSRHIDKWADGWSAKRRKKSKEKETADQQLIEWLSQDPTDLIVQYLYSIIEIIIVSVILFTFVGIVVVFSLSTQNMRIRSACYAAFSISLVLGLQVCRKALNKTRLYMEANHLRRRTLLKEMIEEAKSKSVDRDAPNTQNEPAILLAETDKEGKGTPQQHMMDS